MPIEPEPAAYEEPMEPKQEEAEPMETEQEVPVAVKREAPLAAKVEDLPTGPISSNSHPGECHVCVESRQESLFQRFPASSCALNSAVSKPC